MPKLVLSFDSHALSTFQRCPEEFRLTHVKHLETAQSKSFYDNGTLVHLMLGLYYRLRRRGYSVEKASMAVIEKRYQRFCSKFPISQEDKMLILTRFAEYVSHYRNEMHQPVGIEVGFSEKLYENDSFIFIYEGRVDWIGKTFVEKMGRILHFEDHKTRSQNYELDVQKNQFYGYAWMMKKVFGKDYDGWGSVNYFGLQADKSQKMRKDGSLFERVWFQFSDKEILQWEKDTIFWFFRIAQAMLHNVFPRTWQCDRKFGVCPMKKICVQPEDWQKKLVMIDGVYFKRREKKWTAWE